DQLLSLIRQSLFGRYVTILGEEAGLHFLLRFDDQTKEREAIHSLRQKRIRIVGYQDYFWERNDQASCCFVMGYAGLKEKAMMRFIAEIEDMWMKQHFEFVRPNLSMEKAYFEYLEEWGKEAKMVPFAARFQQDSFEAWLDQKKREEDPQTTPEGWVSATLFALMVDGKIAGFLHLRHDLNEHLLQVGGHIGYGIRPSMRGKGYAKIMLRLGLLEAKKLGLSKVLITADDDNPASYRTIESCGGILENRFHEEEHDVLRYWIDIQTREF
ncbi:MAG: GNAT family N-acetyltransferase, partial [Candidatus Izemoplasmatales bacterium]|nr:GNAT family N-acetyltransferase [Candidatus Izemoplasmatales bacterium]